MRRVIFPKGKQEIWINELLERFNLNAKGLAINIGVHPRTFSDWKRGKISLPFGVFNLLISKFDIEIPKNIQQVPQYWYVHKGARKGALARMKIYGPPGTREGRKKGGKVSQLKRRENPEYYRQLGCIVRKNFKRLRKSEKFAEAVGIILGDGGVTKSQVSITLNRIDDREYAYYVSNLFTNIFSDDPSMYEYKDNNVIVLCLTGVNLVESLEKVGVGSGDKIKRQIDFPSWIWQKSNYQKACVRGLVDTDGGVYFHHHTTKGIKYRNLGLCFTSYSRPLLDSVSKVFSTFKITHTKQSKRIYIYSLSEVIKYFRLFKPNNPKHIKRLECHLSNSTRLS